MASSKNPGEGPITTIANYIYWFLMSNIYFSLLNLPFILIFIASNMQNNLSFNIPLILSLLPIGPALAALFSVMGKLVRNKSINVTSDFFSAYKKNFIEALFVGAAVIAALCLIYADIVYVKTKPNFYALQLILIGVGILIISMTTYIFPIMSRFHFKFTDLIKLSFLYCIKKIHITFFNWICFLAVTIILLKFLSVLLLFLWSILCYLIMLNERNVLKEIEEKYKS